jgi:MSHA pilin protein MshA
MMINKAQRGFTLIELIAVIVILGVLAITAGAKFINLSSDAKKASLTSLAANMEATIRMVNSKAFIKSISAASTNPNEKQSELIIDFGFASSEIHFSNLCPESSAEMGDAVDFLDFMKINKEKWEIRVDNQYSLIGYEVPESGTPTNQGCYIIYDSFATPNCTVEIVDVDC